MLLRDQNNRLAIHTALDQGMKWSNDLLAIMYVNMEHLNEKDPQTGYPPFALLDRPWTPGDALQVEDRVRRIGLTRSVKSIRLRAFQVDEQVDNLIEEQKAINSDAVVKAGSSRHRGRSAPRISIRNLVKSILDGNNIMLDKK